jgi:hypothetical protein
MVYLLAPGDLHMSSDAITVPIDEGVVDDRVDDIGSGDANVCSCVCTRYVARDDAAVTVVKTSKAAGGGQ